MCEVGVGEDWIECVCVCEREREREWEREREREREKRESLKHCHTSEAD